MSDNDGLIADFRRDPATRHWTPEFVESEVFRLLNERHRLITEFDKINPEVERLVQADRERQLAEIRKRHQEAVVRLLQREIALADAIREERRICDEARIAVGAAFASPISPVSPAPGSHDTSRQDSGLSYRIREAIAKGFLSGKEDFLAGVNWKYYLGM